jgi:LPS O-antigen subunit length determinant protein (WzzB/FepE family)
MNHAEQDEEIRIFDYLNILWKRKWFILIPALVLAAAAGIFGFLKTPVWEVDAIIQPGLFLVQYSADQFKETPASEPLRTAIQISLQSFNTRIASELNLDRRRFPVLSAEILKNTWFIRTWLRVTDTDQGTKILTSLLQHLKAGFGQDLDMELKRLETQIFEQENTIKSKRAEIALLEIQKTKSLAQIASEEAKIEISEERRRSISMEMASAKTRTDALEEQLKKAVEAQQKGNDAISLGLLLYSSQVQNNVQYYNLLDEKMNAEKVLQENSRLSIKSKTEDSKENDARIGISKNQIDNTSNAIKLIQERKARIRYAEVIKDPSVSGHPVGPGKVMYIIYGGLIGLFVFSLGALFLERRDQYRSRS